MIAFAIMIPLPRFMTEKRNEPRSILRFKFDTNNDSKGNEGFATGTNDWLASVDQRWRPSAAILPRADHNLSARHICVSYHRCHTVHEVQSGRDSNTYIFTFCPAIQTDLIQHGSTQVDFGA